MNSPYIYNTALFEPLYTRIITCIITPIITPVLCVYREFVVVCHSALVQNSHLITSDQIEYHDLLTQHYRQMAESIGDILGEQVTTHSGHSQKVLMLCIITSN